MKKFIYLLIIFTSCQLSEIKLIVDDCQIDTITYISNQDTILVRTEACYSLNVTIDTLILDTLQDVGNFSRDFPSHPKDSLFHFSSVPGLDSLRNIYTNWLWENGKPTSGLSLIASDIPNDSYNNPNRTQFSNLSRIDKYAATMPNGFVTYVYHYVPIQHTDKSVIVSMGHGDNWGLNGLAWVLLDMVQEGHDVYYMNMPGQGENQPYTSGLHNSWVNLESPSFNPLSVFVEPVIRTLNHIHSTDLTNQLTVFAGMSGGGLTTVLASALEPDRVHESFDFSGSAPLYMREVDPNSAGDYEQGCAVSDFVCDFYSNICSFYDLYALAGQKKKHTQIQNSNDPCCFRGIGYDGYQDVIQGRLDLIGGEFKFILENASSLHSVSQESRSLLINSLKSD